MEGVAPTVHVDEACRRARWTSRQAALGAGLPDEEPDEPDEEPDEPDEPPEEPDDDEPDEDPDDEPPDDELAAAVDVASLLGALSLFSDEPDEPDFSDEPEDPARLSVR